MGNFFLDWFKFEGGGDEGFEDRRGGEDNFQEFEGFKLSKVIDEGGEVGEVFGGEVKNDTDGGEGDIFFKALGSDGESFHIDEVGVIFLIEGGFLCWGRGGFGNGEAI